MKERIYISLSNEKTIQEAIQELEKYKESLINKSELFIKRLADIGVTVAKTAIADASGDSDKDVSFLVTINTFEGDVKGRITISSTPHTDKDGRVFYPHLAWEFGAGIFYNNGNINPKASEFNLGVGSFPNQTHALNDYWWYRDEAGNLHFSKGTEAAMPMYKASLEMISRIEEIAKEVFNG